MSLPVILVDVVGKDVSQKEAFERLEELENLVNTFGGLVVVKKVQRRGIPDYGTFVGKGKIQEIMDDGKALGAKLVVVNNILKPGQVYRLSEQLRKVKMEAWDRIDLILKIFSKHAKSAEAKLQIELAAIRHTGPRIFGLGLDLSRQGGGIGTSGIGETNIERMKRHLKEHEHRVMMKLKHMEKVRTQHREHRARLNLPTAAIVGYTNAGKSSLLRAITKKDAYVANKLFATLDTRIGQLHIQNETPQGINVMLSDTIGFIRDLPPSLIKSFKSTLEEAIHADIILHVIDYSDPKMEDKIMIVEDILKDLGLGDRPQIFVFNKYDLPSPFAKFEIERQYATFSPVFVSAERKVGLQQLKETIKERLLNKTAQSSRSPRRGSEGSRGKPRPVAYSSSSNLSHSS